MAYGTFTALSQDNTSYYLSFVLFDIQLVQVPQPLCSSIGILSQALGSVDVQDTNRRRRGAERDVGRKERSIFSKEDMKVNKISNFTFF